MTQISTLISTFNQQLDISPVQLETSIPLLVGVFTGVEDGQIKQEWQKAVAALCLVLLVAAREREVKFSSFNSRLLYPCT